MRTLYLDCQMGAAGDMLTAALLELLPDKEAFFSQMNRLGLPGVCLRAERMEKCGIGGTHVTVTIDGCEEDEAAHHHEHEHEHHHEHEHEHVHEYEHEHHHEHGHHHSGMADITGLIAQLPLPEKAREDALSVYRLLAEAESTVHGVPMDEIHFHEVGTLDAVTDITAVCLLMYLLSPEQVVVSPIHVGTGQIRCAHGILPVPAPATALLLKGVPIYGGRIQGELCTPTGAALLKYFADSFGSMPVMETAAVGYGMGKKDFEAANCVRAFWGRTGGEEEAVTELRCNVDDMTPEDIGFAMERLWEAGVLEAYTLPAAMKKGRPGVLICVLCREAQREEILRLLFCHTSTLGVRENLCRRYTLGRSVQTVATPVGPVRRKVSDGRGIQKQKWEYEDLARLAREQGCSLADIRKKLDSIS
ncbi:MAG: nickel pincer cofactor biosynthesis protein LarC [Clostridiales bacterium]|nr:nickel pincer cofactor biosynthesis protein LarC [Clostridiales bacterium]